MMCLSPVPPTFILKTQHSGAGLFCGEKFASSSDHRESCPNAQLGPGVAPWSLSLRELPSPVVFTLRFSTNSHPFTCLSSLRCQPWQKCCAIPALSLSLPAMGKALQPRSRASMGSGHAGAAAAVLVVPGCPWLSWLSWLRAQQVSRGVLGQKFVLQGENAMRNRVHCVMAQTCGGFFIDVVLG